MAEGAPLLREYRAKHLIEGSNPSLSARYAKRPEWGVLRIWRREVVDELTVRQIRLERIWTAAGWPRSAQRAGVNPMDGIHNPSLHATALLTGAESPQGTFCESGRGKVGTDLERAARKGWTSRKAEQSLADSSFPNMASTRTRHLIETSYPNGKSDAKWRSADHEVNRDRGSGEGERHLASTPRRPGGGGSRVLMNAGAGRSQPTASPQSSSWP